MQNVGLKKARARGTGHSRYPRFINNMDGERERVRIVSCPILEVSLPISNTDPQRDRHKNVSLIKLTPPGLTYFLTEMFLSLAVSIFKPGFFYLECIEKLVYFSNKQTKTKTKAGKKPHTRVSLFGGRSKAGSYPRRNIQGSH